MKTLNLTTKTIVILVTGLFFFQCSDDISLNEVAVDNFENVFPRAAFDDYFEWDRLNKFPVYNTNIGRVDSVEIPWAPGASWADGIPIDWQDENAYNPTFSERYYSRENHWELVYSNLYKYTPDKYFALYNSRTGLLRFFFYTLSNAKGTPTSSSFWGISINKSSSLFNFNGEFADGNEKKGSTPTYVSTPPGVQMGTSFQGKGYQVNKWYGIEVECAYDSSIQPGSNHNFELAGWSAVVSRITGNGNTTGTIKGTIQYASPDINFNIGLSQMFSNTSNANKNIIINNEGIVDGLGGTIEEGISRNDSFFKGLWNGIKRKAGSGIGDGVKAGLTTLMSSGGSIAAKALSGAVNSILGIGSNKLGQVDLALSANTRFELESVSFLDGWGNVTSLPVPGASTNPYNMPLYNEPLGVWNLKKNPVLEIEAIAHDFYLDNDRNFYKGIYNFKYFLNCTQNDLEINSSIRDQVTIRNFNVEIASDENNQFIFGYGGQMGEYGTYEPEPFGFLGNRKYYSKIINSWRNGIFYRAAYGSVFRTNYPSYEFVRLIYPGELDHGTFKAVVSFDMVDNATGQIYSFSRWFNVEFGSQKTNFANILITNRDAYDNYAESIMYNSETPSYGYDIISSFDIVKQP